MTNYKEEDAIVLFSGGQDSTTCLFWAKKRFRKVHALCINYGQRHHLELEVAREIAEKAGFAFQVIDASLIAQLAPNALTNQEIAVDSYQEQPQEAYPNTFVPARNLLFLSFAAAIAYSRKIPHIVTGVSEVDYSGYPDCRENFILSANQSINLAMDTNFRIHTPLMHLDKAAVWALAEELGIFALIKNKTLTCYNGIIAEGCGECPACQLRKKGLESFTAKKK